MFAYSNTFAQFEAPYIKWDDYNFKDSIYDNITATIKTSTNTIISVGNTRNNKSFLVKHNLKGDQILSNFYGNNTTNFFNILEKENYYYVVGSTGDVVGDFSDNPNAVKKALVIKLDTNGNVIWKYYYQYYDCDNDTCNYNDCFYSIISDNNNLILGGNCFIDGSYKSILIKLNLNGNSIVWENSFEGNMGIWNCIKDIEISETTGNYLITGDIYGWVAKINQSNGDTIWTKKFGIDSFPTAFDIHSTRFYNIITSNNNYLLVGRKLKSSTTNESDGWLIKIDENGSLIESRFYNNYPDNNEFYSICENINNEFIICGCTNDYRDGWLLKLDSNLNVLWENIYGGSRTDLLSSIVLYNGNIIVSGYTNSTDGDLLNKPIDVSNSVNSWLIFFKDVVVTPNHSIQCGASDTLICSDAEHYFWSTGDTTKSIIVTPSITTTYYVTATSGTASDVDNVIVTTNPPTAEAGNNISICLNSSNTLTASGGNTYSWSNGATTTSIIVSPTTDTEYFVTAYSEFGCTAIDSVMVSVLDLPIAYAGEDVSTCKGDSVELIASGGAPYSWSTTETDSTIYVAPIVITTYTVTTTHENGCTASDDVVVNTFTASAGNDQTICLGTSTTLVATGGGTYSWSTGATTSTIVVSPTVNTSYSVTVTNNVGCTDDASITVIIACARPSNIMLTGVSYNYTFEHYQINLAWDAIVCANSYYLYRRKVGDSTWTAQVYSTNLPAFYADSNATYECFSRTICVSSDTSISSDTIQFTTPTNPSCHDNKPTDLSAYYCNITQYATFMWTGAIDCYDSIGFSLFWRDSTITDTSWFSTNPLAGTSQISKKVSPTCIWKIREKYNNNYPTEYKLLSDFSAKIAIDTVGGCSKSYKGNFTIKIPNASGDLVSEINAFPNPFNSQVNISYSLNENTNVRIEVYDIMGQKITTVCNEQQQAGDYNIPFSVNASHGVYILKLSTPTKIFQTRIIKME